MLLVSDNLLINELVRQSLSGLCTCFSSESSEAALQAVHDLQPDLLLLDCSPGSEIGFELSRAVRSTCPSTWIIFLDAHPDEKKQDAQMAAYLAGADDYLASPFSDAELLHKAELLLQRAKHTRHLQSALQDANAVAMQAISNISEQGGIIDFARRAMKCTDAESLLRALLFTLGNHFNLKAVVQIQFDGQRETLNTEGRSSPLEAALLARHAEDGTRIFQYGRRLVVHYPGVVVQLKDLPLENEEYVGRLRDHLALMAETAEYRLRSIRMEAENRRQARLIQGSLTQIRGVIHMLECNYKQQQSDVMDLFDAMRGKLAPLLIQLGLNDQQEHVVMSEIERAIGDADELYNAGLQLDGHFAGVLAMLASLAEHEPEIVSQPLAVDEDQSVLLF